MSFHEVNLITSMCDMQGEGNVGACECECVGQFGLKHFQRDKPELTPVNWGQLVQLGTKPCP